MSKFMSMNFDIFMSKIHTKIITRKRNLQLNNLRFLCYSKSISWLAWFISANLSVFIAPKKETDAKANFWNFCKFIKDKFAAFCGIYPLFVNPTITNCCKELHLKCGRGPKSIFENVVLYKIKSGFMWKQVFFLVSKCWHFYQKSLCFSLLLFTVWWSNFDKHIFDQNYLLEYISLIS